MKNFFIVLLLTVFLVSCNFYRNKTDNMANDATKDIIIAERDTVWGYLNHMLNTDAVRFEQHLLDSMYFSKELLSLQIQGNNNGLNNNWIHQCPLKIINTSQKTNIFSTLRQ